MKKINLSRVLVENRHKRGLTQDDLVAYMGVSKPLYQNGKLERHTPTSHCFLSWLPTSI